MEKEVFKKLYETYYMQVYSYAMTLAKRQCMAEEIAQETFYRAFTSKSTFRGEANAITWLCAIAKNLYFDEIRRQSKRAQIPPGSDTDSGLDMERELEDRDASYQIHLALQELEEPYRRVFEMRIFGEMSFQEIGSVFTKTDVWARVTYHRAKRKLQERMGVYETHL